MPHQGVEPVVTAMPRSLKVDFVLPFSCDERLLIAVSMFKYMLSWTCIVLSLFKSVLLTFSLCYLLFDTHCSTIHFCLVCANPSC